MILPHNKLFFSIKMSSKKQRKVLTLDEKSRIIQRKLAGEKAINIASSMGLLPTTVRSICNRDLLKIQETVANVSSTLSKTITRTRHPIFERMESYIAIIYTINEFISIKNMSFSFFKS